jgi:peroxiredoxin
MEGHQRNLSLYDRFNARVLGVSRDDVTTLKYWAEGLGVTFPLLSNITSFFGVSVGAQPEGRPIFSRRTIVVDKKGIIRYARDGSPNFKDILLFLKKLNQEGEKP